jgi:plastocyanin
MYSASLPIRSRPAHVTRLAVALAAFVLACGGGGSAPTGPSTPGTPGTPGTPSTPSPTITTSVNLQNSTFSPPDIQVSPGATVTFTNNDGINHTVTFDNTSITSIDSYTTGAKTVTMPTATGTYAFHCQFHGNMRGTVLVK